MQQHDQLPAGLEGRRRRDRPRPTPRAASARGGPRPRAVRARRRSSVWPPQISAGRSGCEAAAGRRASSRPSSIHPVAIVAAAHLAIFESDWREILMAIGWTASGNYTDIRYETGTDDATGIAKITIYRPEVRNAFRPQTLFELQDAFERARDDTEIGVIIFTGEGPRGVLLRRRPADPRRRRLHRRRRGRPEGHRTAQRARPAGADPPAAEAGGRDGRRLRDRRRPRAARRLRPDDRRRQRALRPDRPEGRQLRRRLRRRLPGAHRRPQEGARDLVPVPPVRRPAGARDGPGQHGRAARPARSRRRCSGAARCCSTRRSRCGC